MARWEGYADVLGTERKQRTNSSSFIVGSQQVLLKLKSPDIANTNCYLKMWQQKTKESAERTKEVTSKEEEMRRGVRTAICPNKS